MAGSGTAIDGADQGGALHRRTVSSELTFAVFEATELVVQLAPSSSAGLVVVERLGVTSDGQSVEPGEVPGPHGTRSHQVLAGPGRLTITFRSEIDPFPATTPATTGSDGVTDQSADQERLTYLRPSRYCPSDHLVGFAVAEFGTESGVRSRVEAIVAWIRGRVGYVAGSSSVHDSAEHTLLTGMGTCRDFAHLGVALCRAVGIPARFASVYAPGLSPMDFHAVFEALIDGTWYAFDATDLAPRPSMVRIATGRDAADAAFASVISGIATLEWLEVTATTAGDLPEDDHTGLVALT